MGVIYKLREDVVSFINHQKRNNPSISVRKLASLTSEKFQIKVSKSSVNDVLKKASLSSSVGRRLGASVQTEKFSIPVSKKKEISENLKKTGFIPEMPAPEIKKAEKTVFPVEKKEIPKTEKPKIAQTSPEIPRESKPSFVHEPEILPENPLPPEKKFSDIPAKEDLVQNVLQEQASLRKADEARREEQGKGTLVSSGMGFIFLKAAQWEIAGRSPISQIFSKYIGRPVSGRFDSVSDMFLFSRLLADEPSDLASDDQGRGLRVLNDFCHPAIHESKDKMELQELFHWSNSIENPLLQEMIMEYKRAKEQIFTEIKGFGLLLEDQSEISMDSAMSSFSGGRDFFPGDRGGVPMDKALSRLSACLVSNIRSAIFYKAPGEAKFDRVFYDMLAMFNNVPGKKIIKASMIDDHDQKIAEFSVIPSHKRRFLMGICPQQKEFEGLTKTAKWAAKQSFYHRGTDRILRFSEIKVDSIETLKPEKSSAFRIITVWKNDDQKPCWAILTNCARQNSEEILKEYMMRWPYFGEDIKEGSVLELTDSSAVQELPEESIGNVQEMCNDFIVSLHRYCQKHFFPKNYSRIDVNSLLATVYGMSGTFYALKDSMVVSLDMDQGLGYYKDLQYAVRKVNERHIFDYSGRRLWLKT